MDGDRQTVPCERFCTQTVPLFMTTVRIGSFTFYCQHQLTCKTNGLSQHWSCWVTKFMLHFLRKCTLLRQFSLIMMYTCTCRTYPLMPHLILTSKTAETACSDSPGYSVSKCLSQEAWFEDICFRFMFLSWSRHCKWSSSSLHQINHFNLNLYTDLLPIALPQKWSSD